MKRKKRIETTHLVKCAGVDSASCTKNSKHQNSQIQLKPIYSASPDDAISAISGMIEKLVSKKTQPHLQTIEKINHLSNSLSKIIRACGSCAGNINPDEMPELWELMLPKHSDSRKRITS